MIVVNNQNNNKGQNDFWIGFSDLMTGLMLVFIVLALTFMAISKEKSEKSEKAKEKIEKLLLESESNKLKVETLLKDARKKNEELEKWKEKLRQAQKELEKKQKSIIVILSNALSSHNIEVEYNKEKGTVTIAQDILFEKKEYRLKPKGKEFISLFAHILDDQIFSKPSYQDLIKYIHIEGYASKEGTEKYNFQLSFERAQSVWFDMTNQYLEHKNIMREKLNIVSRGEIEANQYRNDANDRKVVFRFEFYDKYNKLFEGLSTKVKETKLPSDFYLYQGN